MSGGSGSFDSSTFPILLYAVVDVSRGIIEDILFAFRYLWRFVLCNKSRQGDQESSFSVRPFHLTLNIILFLNLFVHQHAQGFVQHQIVVDPYWQQGEDRCP
jgi:hypothetical protein